MKTVHHMKLHTAPFDMIRCGMKTIELRLYDEKRQMIHQGDLIVFSKSDDLQVQITAEVVGLHIFGSFEEVYRSLPLNKCGYRADEVENASAEDMLAYYSAEQQRRFGVVGIEIQVQNN